MHSDKQNLFLTTFKKWVLAKKSGQIPHSGTDGRQHKKTRRNRCPRTHTGTQVRSKTPAHPHTRTGGEWDISEQTYHSFQTHILQGPSALLSLLCLGYWPVIARYLCLITPTHSHARPPERCFPRKYSKINSTLFRLAATRKQKRWLN